MKIEKECTSCGEKGHHWNECNNVNFAGLLVGAMGMDTKPLFGEDINTISERANKHLNRDKN